MIHYALSCSNRHEFAGWFKSSASFDEQAATGLLECPVCGDTHVSRALMSPAVMTARAAPVPVPTPQPPAAPPQAQQQMVSGPGAQLPAQVLAALQRLRTAVEKNCDYVGTEFPEVARSIHRGETEHRGIYGEATPEQAELLADEGIQVTPIPWVSRAEG
jgi:hypothetical protein